MSWMRGAVGLLAAVLLQACGDTAARPEGPERAARASEALEAQAEPGDILARLKALPGVTVVAEKPSTLPGTRFFVLSIELPADHRHPEGEHFPLRATLLHRSVDAPMVLFSGGYMLGSTRPGQYEPTALLQANQLYVEHRFFGTSWPASRDWTLLNIEQAAGDYHHLVQTFKPLYTGRWLTTGGSKGGMTAVYHRYFYPDDVDATVAYVTPNTRGLNDVRFVDFLEHVGDADCRERLVRFQQEALGRREELRPHMEELAGWYGTGYGILGTDRALEFAIVEMPFYFWQYGGAYLCPLIPAPGAPADEMFHFIDSVDAIFDTYTDYILGFFEAYYYQSATELGWNRYPTRELHGLLRYPREDVPALYLPFKLEARFDQDLMLRVEHWVRNEGRRMMFLYGDHDPWSAGPFDVREGNDSWSFTVPDANHSNARIVRLPEPERTQALQRLSEWMGVPAGPRASALAAGGEAGGGEDIVPLVEGHPWL